MAENCSDNLRKIPVPLGIIARWTTNAPVVRKSVTIVDGASKPTLLVGSKRRQKVESYSPLKMTAQVGELYGPAIAGVNILVDELNGKQVTFELRNKYCFGWPDKPLVFEAQLNNLAAEYELDEAYIRDVIFQKGGQLDARVNENLLEFHVSVPDLNIAADSENRVLIYRNRLIIFVPGLLGSTIALKTSKGLVQVYPNVFPDVKEGQEDEVKPFYSDLSWLTAAGFAYKSVDGAVSFANYVGNAVAHRELGVLECDELGNPLFTSKPELFRSLLGGGAAPVVLRKIGASPVPVLSTYAGMCVVYDVQRILAERWAGRGEYRNRPSDFSPFTIIPRPYDWRLDLENLAQELFGEYQKWQKYLQSQEDYDDLLIISGHSTGGVINRRICGLDGVGSIVEHSFFINVPFRGAPKALSVMLFGGDPPVTGYFDVMMPGLLMDAETMVYIAGNLPILYFLAPSNSYPDPVCTLSSDLLAELNGAIAGNPNQRDGEKANLLLAATLTGTYQPVRPVPASASQDVRAQIAAGATEWLRTWTDCGRRNAYGEFWDRDALSAYNNRKLHADDNLVFQGNTRRQTPVGWNQTIAQNAATFHQLSESRIGASPVNLWIFWSKAHPTTGSVDMQLDGGPERLTPENWGIVPSSAYTNDGKYPEYELSKKFDFRYQWWRDGWVRRWVKFSGQLVDGDGTVPRASLLGIGTSNAKIFMPTTGDPKHVPAPDNDYVWQRILELLLGDDPGPYLGDYKAENVPYSA